MLTLILLYIISGLIIGALARLVVPGRNPIGIVMTILVGIAGSILGGLVSHALGLNNLLSLVAAVAIAALIVYAISGSRRRRVLR